MNPLAVSNCYSFIQAEPTNKIVANYILYAFTAIVQPRSKPMSPSVSALQPDSETGVWIENR